jgi:hypothetical protein
MIKASHGDHAVGSARKSIVAALLGAVVVLLHTVPGGSVRGQQPKPEAQSAKFPGHVFVWSKGGQVEGVLSVDPNANTWTQLPEKASATGRVSPDGTKMVCPPSLPPRGRDLSTWIVPLTDEGDPIRVDVPATAGLKPVVWSGDGRQFLVSYPLAELNYAKFETWRFAHDGTGKTKLPIASSELVHDWSPDGKWLLTQSARPPWNESDVRSMSKRPCYLMRPDGTDERLLLSAPGADGLPSDVRGTNGHRFSPDGQSVLYLEIIEMKVEDRPILRLRLCMIGVDGKGRRIIRDGTARQMTMGAVWSPDGNWIAATILELKDGADLEKPRIGEFVPRVELLDKTGATRKTLPLPPAPMGRVVDWR